MHKFFVSKENFFGDRAIISGEDVKHIYKVLRLSVGDKISINNCEGEEFLAEINEIDKKQVLVNIISKLDIKSESDINIYLFQGLPKSSKMDMIVQKATELGVKEICPIITKRVVVKNELGEFKKLDRWQRITLEACKQCKRTIIPNIKEPIEFEGLIDALEDIDLIVVPYENEKGYGIKNMLAHIKVDDIKNVAIIIGPEGGFEEEEIEELKHKGAHIVTLGPRILRTETAGFVCAALLQYELADLGGII